MQNFGLFRTGANQEKSFGSASGVTSDIRVVSWRGMVNGQEVFGCPKLQHSIGIFYRMLRAPKSARGSSTTAAELRYKSHPGPAVCRMPALTFHRSAPTQRSVLYTASFRSEEHTSELQSRRDLVC